MGGYDPRDTSISTPYVEAFVLLLVLMGVGLSAVVVGVVALWAWLR